MKNLKSLNEFINENMSSNTEIEIVKQSKDNYFVNYQTMDDIEIEGNLVMFNTGRSKEFKFEPSYIQPEYQEYYDDNWESIEDEILSYFWKNKDKIDQ